jgi:hypothetical protein
MLNHAMLTAEAMMTAITDCSVGTRRERQHGLRHAGNALQLPANLNGDTRAAFGTAGIDHAAATNGFHANSKAMGFLSAGHGGLVGTFHDYSLQMTNAWKIFAWPSF